MIAAVLAFHLMIAAHPTQAPASVTQTTGVHHAIALPVGGSTKISFKGVSNYSLANAGIVDVVIDPTGTGAQVTGRRPGTTTLLVRYHDGSTLLYDVVVS